MTPTTAAMTATGATMSDARRETDEAIRAAEASAGACMDTLQDLLTKLETLRATLREEARHDS